MQKTIRNVDEDLFEEAKKLAREKGMTMGEAVNEALLEWINSEEPEVSIMDLEPMELGDDSENLSENYKDELYG